VKSTNPMPGAQARRAKVRTIGYGVPSDFELNFGRYLAARERTTMRRIRGPTDCRPESKAAQGARRSTLGVATVAKPMDRNECKDLHNLEKFVL
jgi:hypothetical protein